MMGRGEPDGRRSDGRWFGVGGMMESSLAGLFGVLFFCNHRR